MKTVLIVEDEKMIRQGIKMMIQRSGIPVEIIMECNNGVMALEILKNQEVDVMFTDIRMPKMDGIELVKAIQDLPHKPLVAVISGYDDFSYAVEMLRLGVKEYILKPVDREKIVEVLTKLEAEVQRTKANAIENRSIGYQQLKFLVMNENITQSELDVLINTYEESFFPNYVVYCLNNTAAEYEVDGTSIYLSNIEDNELFITEDTERAAFLRKELRGRFAGISRIHSGLLELKEAYRESYRARVTAFWTCTPVVDYEETVSWQEQRMKADSDDRNCGEGEIDGSEFKRNKLVKTLEPEPDEKTMVQLAQMLGTERADEAIETLKRIFAGAQTGYYDYDKMEQNLQVFFKQIREVYKNVVRSEEEKLEQFAHIYRYASSKELFDDILAFLKTFVETMNNQFDDYRNKQKIQMAIRYITENYDKDLNMAVVSNYISMNYSLFSYVFKQYTGSNFVNYLKDLRMKEAKRLLEETDLRVNEISQKIGYDNEKHFMKTFKSVCGVSPTEYRKNMQFKE